MNHTANVEIANTWIHGLYQSRAKVVVEYRPGCFGILKFGDATDITKTLATTQSAFEYEKVDGYTMVTRWLVPPCVVGTKIVKATNQEFLACNNLERDEDIPEVTPTATGWLVNYNLNASPPN